MKYFLIAAVFIFLISFGKHTGEPCKTKIVQSYYFNGQLVYTKSYDSISINKGCYESYYIGGKSFIADSVVTTLK